MESQCSRDLEECGAESFALALPAQEKIFDLLFTDLITVNDESFPKIDQVR